MSQAGPVTTAYDLPFEVWTSPGPLLSAGGTVQLLPSFRADGGRNPKLMGELFGVFAGLAATGALGGDGVEPGRSGFKPFAPGGSRFALQECRLSERALVVLVHLLLGRHESLGLRRLELSVAGKTAGQPLTRDPESHSTYPSASRPLPFDLTDDEPETGAYTLEIQLARPVEPRHLEGLEHAFRRWTEAILAGAYGLAPIPPPESYVEPYSDCVTAFDANLEWMIFKLRADPAAIEGLLNILAAFHVRSQEVLAVAIR